MSTTRESPKLFLHLFVGLALIFSASGCSGQVAAESPGYNVAPTKTSDMASSQATPISPKNEIIGLGTTQRCEELVTPQELYEFNPNFSPGTQAQIINPFSFSEFEVLKGVTCAFISLTNKDSIQVSIARVDSLSLQTLGEMVRGGGDPVPALSNSKTQVFFRNSNGMSVLQVLQGNYWLAVNSSLLSSPGDAYGFVRNTLGRL